MPKRIPKWKQLRFISLLLEVSGWAKDGMTENHIHEVMGGPDRLTRRAVNNYLRELKDEGFIEKRGRRWYHRRPF